MNQPVAKISFQEIKRIIKRDFSQYESSEVLDVLNQYSSDSGKLNYRVWAGALKLSKGDIDDLKKNIELAKSDFRDILANAEYPKYSDQVGFDKDAFAESEIDAIIMEDWNQYQNWLKT